MAKPRTQTKRTNWMIDKTYITRREYLKMAKRAKKLGKGVAQYLVELGYMHLWKG